MDFARKMLLIQKEYHSILLFLAAVRKVLKDANKEIRKSKENSNWEISFLKQKYMSSQNNSFDCIVPTKKKLVEIR